MSAASGLGCFRSRVSMDTRLLTACLVDTVWGEGAEKKPPLGWPGAPGTGRLHEREACLQGCRAAIAAGGGDTTCVLIHVDLTPLIPPNISRSCLTRWVSLTAGLGVAQSA